MSSCEQPYVSVTELEQAVADYFRRVRVPKARLWTLRDEILAAFAGKHADGEAEITRQKVRIQRLAQRAMKNKEAYFGLFAVLSGLLSVRTCRRAWGW